MDIFYYFSKAKNESPNPKPVRIQMNNILNIGDKFDLTEFHYNQLTKSMQDDFKNNKMELGEYTVVDVRNHSDEEEDSFYNFKMIFLEK